jgi:hypothetical protein
MEDLIGKKHGAFSAEPGRPFFREDRAAQARADPASQALFQGDV